MFPLVPVLGQAHPKTPPKLYMIAFSSWFQLLCFCILITESWWLNYSRQDWLHFTKDGETKPILNMWGGKNIMGRGETLLPLTTPRSVLCSSHCLALGLGLFQKQPTNGEWTLDGYANMKNHFLYIKTLLDFHQIEHFPKAVKVTRWHIWHQRSTM